MPQDCPGMHHQGSIATKMQTSQELQARTGQKEIGNAITRPLKIRQWRPPPQQREPGSFEFVFYAGPSLNSESIDPYPGLKDPASWRIPKKEATPRQDLIVPTGHFIATRKDISPNQGPPAPPLAPPPPTPPAPAPAPSLVPTHQAPISMIQKEEVDEEDTRINYIRPIPPERLKALQAQIEEDVDSDALAEQQLVTEYQRRLNSTRPKSKKPRGKGTKKVRHGILRRDIRGKRKNDSQSTCEEDLIALATEALLTSKLAGLADGKPPP
ncbi:hypothetical protein NA56DRAFT_430384 [Hyaloscypha hepaticicola]|uniref:Uncharacterized protein n=1 Tax=Hyaloscypha hepaticicola TaxID=2082293 RepID=A0A2J6QG90_9HELO|nr:hypothetical protein NA56DRAFT_430384 [Hyaloscypha hepaticicola]